MSRPEFRMPRFSRTLPPLSTRIGCVLVAVFFVCQTGCVQRRMVVRSNPPGALVYVDDQAKPIGVTPCAHDFTYYGTRKFRLVKEGYETVTEMRDIAPPWYEYPCCDFVSENLVPGQIRDQRTLDFTLTPQLVVSSDQILSRGEQLRREMHQETGTTSQLVPKRPTTTAQPWVQQPAMQQPAAQPPIQQPAAQTPPWQPAGNGAVPTNTTAPAASMGNPFATQAPATTPAPASPQPQEASPGYIGGQPTYSLP